MGTENSNSKKAPRRRGRKGNDEGGAIQKVHQSNVKQNNVSFSAQKGQNEIVTTNSLSYKVHKSLLIHLTEQTPTWYDCGRHTPGRDDTISNISSSSPVPDTGSNHKKRFNAPHILQKYRKLADQIYLQEISLFKDSDSGGGSDERWVETTMKRGTLKDRVAAMSVVVSTNPVHKLYALDMLLNLAGVATSDTRTTSQPNARVSQMAAEALADLFSNTLIPSTRKLYALDSRPLFLYDEDCDSVDQNTGKGNKDNKGKQNKISKIRKTLSPRILLLWRYEEMIKHKYNSFLAGFVGKTLSEASLDLNKSYALRTAAGLFRDLPEGEQVLLIMMVNKIGDPSRKIAAAAGHQLRQILSQHPQMVNIVAREVQQLAHRPHLSSRALYNCIVFLNQLKLSHDDELDKQSSNPNSKPFSLPSSLIKTYFHLFEVAVKIGDAAKDGKAIMRSRLLSALLTGVNRAHPYLPANDKSMEDHVNSLYRISHISPPAASTQALMLLFHLAIGTSDDTHDDDKSQSDKLNDKTASGRKGRFYRALYSKLSDPAMLKGRQVTMFFNLIYKAMKNDTEDTRVIAFAKRLLHTTIHSSSAVIAGSLFLLSEVMKYQTALSESISKNMDPVYDPLKREPTAAFTPANDRQENTHTLVITDGEPTQGFGSLWETTLTLQHYHPSVSKFTSSVGQILYNGDPLRDFTLVPFLDKFAFRNAKSTEKISRQISRGESVGERRRGMEGTILALSSLPVNDPSFLQSLEVHEDEKFFHKFFVERAKRDEVKGITRGKGDAKENEEKDEEDGESEEEDFDIVGDTKDADFDWESDQEEDEFAQSLAEKLMENAGNGKANFDDEDPDLEGWSDSEDDEGESKDDESNSDKGEGKFTDEDDSDSDNQSNDNLPVFGNEDESDSDDIYANFVTEEDESDADDESDDGKSSNKRKGGVTGGKKGKSSNFVDADDYDTLVSNAQEKRDRKSKDRPKDDLKSHENNNTIDEAKSKNRKKKKRKVT